MVSGHGPEVRWRDIMRAAMLVRDGLPYERYLEGFLEITARARGRHVRGRAPGAGEEQAARRSAPPPPDIELVFDRPFLYQILHEDTGMPLFLGTVMAPGQT